MKNLTRKELEKMIPKIELLDPDQIQLNPSNPRTMTERRFKDLVKSVESFWQMLFIRPIILDDDGVALGGNSKTLAARKVGFKLVPIIRAAMLTPSQKREFIVKDNLHAGDWNFDDLANNWDASLLNDWGFTLPEFKAPDSKEVKFSAKVKTPVYDITLKADTELARQALIIRLEGAGFIQDQDYFIE